MAMAVIVKEEIMKDELKTMVRIEQNVLAKLMFLRNHSEQINIPITKLNANIMSLIHWPATNTKVDVCNLELRLIA